MFQTDEDGDVTLKATLNKKSNEEKDAYIYSLLERCGKTDEYSEEAHQNFRRKLHEWAEEERKNRANQFRSSNLLLHLLINLTVRLAVLPTSSKSQQLRKL